jgi:NAD(P) transhydrogenase subunit beta
VLFVFERWAACPTRSRPAGATRYGIIGMALALVATLLDPSVGLRGSSAARSSLGGAIGAVLAARVAMTAMPELVALLHSFVGLAAVLVGLSSTYLDPGNHASHAAASSTSSRSSLDVGIGALTFTGSVVAWGKLRAALGPPAAAPRRHALNLGLRGPRWWRRGAVRLGTAAPAGLPVAARVMSAVAALLGVHLVMAIGGADMPVVVSLLNSYSGWTAAAAGFMLENDLLIVTGALVGSSGAILSHTSCARR